MHRLGIAGLILFLLAPSCGSGGNGQHPDAAPPRPDTRPVPSDDAAGVESSAPAAVLDGGRSGPGCNEPVMGANYCIKNPGVFVNGVPVGGGGKVLRQPPVNAESCRQ